MCKKCEEFLDDERIKMANSIEKYSEELLALFVKIDSEINADLNEEETAAARPDQTAMFFAPLVLGYMQSRQEANIFAVDLFQEGAMIGHAKKCVDKSRTRH